MAKKEKNMKPENNKKSKKEEKNKRRFFKDFKAELKRVVWPTPKQLLNSTIAVITIVDIGFELLNEYGINKLQIKLQEKYADDSVDTNTTSEETNSDEASSEDSNAENNNAETAE